jgi:hypothetical protein
MEDAFRRVFQIPADHLLTRTSFRSSAGSQRDRWTHEEFDPTGKLIAKYESWMNTTIRPLETKSGWRKLDPLGRVLFEFDDLPI